MTGNCGSSSLLLCEFQRCGCICQLETCRYQASASWMLELPIHTWSETHEVTHEVRRVCGRDCGLIVACTLMFSIVYYEVGTRNTTIANRRRGWEIPFFLCGSLGMGRGVHTPIMYNFSEYLKKCVCNYVLNRRMRKQTSGHGMLASLVHAIDHALWHSQHK